MIWQWYSLEFVCSIINSLKGNILICANASRVSAFGMTFDDHGNASFFAVVDQSLALQRERIAEQKEEKAAEKKLAAKKAAEKLSEEKAADKTATKLGKNC